MLRLTDLDPGDVVDIGGELFVKPHDADGADPVRMICLTHYAPLILGFAGTTECRYIGRANLDVRVPSVLSHVIERPADDGRPK